MRAYLTRVLAPNWTVRTTANGEDALQAVAERRPDIVLTDVMMPRVDGFELLRAMRSDPATRHIPVIMLTARAGQEASVEGLEAGADDYLAKPFRSDELIARVRVALQRAAGRSAAAPGNGGPVTGATRLPLAATAPGVARTGKPDTARPGPPVPRPAETGSGTPAEEWRLPSTASAIPALRRRLRAWLEGAGIDEDQAYDLLLAACEAATNAVEHAQAPTEPFVDVAAEVGGGRVLITVRDYGQWRERVPSMDRGRGATLMSAFAEISAVPSPEGTTVTIRVPRTDGADGTDASA
jgi:CheY-like chemotaxis protein/anti-sigma regulatory factor (Ser/Thr protein kinase)